MIASTATYYFLTLALVRQFLRILTVGSQKNQTTMNTPIATLQEVFTAIKDIGYTPKIDGDLITVDLNPEPGIARCYTIENVNESWLVNQKIIVFTEGQGEAEEEENELGSFRAALEVACAIDKEEESD